ncbi:MAG: hypothetical protein AVDCRST_MAG64-845 [uncultured Phycisphaerae bacterium]|uniref:Uncharacterized protein n=1 Tax=uncultured Phycisphaerae bacterium TaxID=904963 RepID=A0A6J4NDH4_9BACT|nr:MAG: hypothetical protein AVDCRST_MAG64-845 [uncultured Phycisphaerae bacterium]
MEWVYYATLAVILLCGLLLNVLTLPGNWLMLLALVGYAWLTGFNTHVGWAPLIALLVLAALGEVVEFFAAGTAASKLGGSRWGTVGAILGGLLGGIFLTALIPIPVVGTLAGVLIGTFLGAAGGELIAGKEVGSSVVIGGAATKGRLYGTLLKLAFGIVMFVVAMVTALPT